MCMNGIRLRMSLLFQKKSIHTLENKVLMHQCAIAQRISKSIASPIPPQKGRANQLAWGGACCNVQNC